MRVLITRPAADVASTSTALAAAGHEVASYPLIAAERIADAKLNLVGAQAFIVSDPEGARALADVIGVRTFPVYADGAAAAETARNLGFSEVIAGSGDAAELARLIQSRTKPELGALIHACSTNAAINLSAMLNTMGFSVRAVPLYAIKRVDALPAA
ncbi:MAG: uroporphyrinogen-III synthase, partial [Alphaproteobacteria bacterium]|nr:uroporphyrinogen-III synthase [Alphaproteobacteria bacterium]